jgi:prepilin-type N-terminal cleavage/methylation domain-containing protein
MPGMRRAGGFTLIEIMIVVSVIALLALIAVPSFLRARDQTREAKFVNVLRVASGAFEMYATEHNGGYPPEVGRGIVPAGMDTYFGPSLDWTKPTPLGGNWDWDYNVFGFTAGISAVGTGATRQQMQDVDSKIDDGNLFSGKFQRKGGRRYSYIIE